jgi:hypothetical protein
MMVHVLKIESKYGGDVSVHSTNGKARKALDDYVKSNWFDMFHDPYNPSDDEAMPKTRDERIERYFEKTQSIGLGGGEYHEICECEVDAQ